VQPLVSIIIPVYNGGNFLAEAIRSALDQTYRNIEIIIVNDGSDDAGQTERVAKSFAHCTRYFYKANGGVASALNMGIEQMHGDYFSWLSHDDLYCPRKIEHQISLLTELGANTIVYGNFGIFDEENKLPVQVKLSAPTAEQFRCWLIMKSALHGCTLLIPRSAFSNSVRFREDLRTCQDFEMWFRLAATFRFLHDPEVVVLGRGHAGQDSVRKASAAAHEADLAHHAFLTTLRNAEVTALLGADLKKAYVMLFRSLRSRNFSVTAGLAGDRAKEHGLSKLRFTLEVICADVVWTFRQLLRRAISPRSRQKLIGFFRNG
jgi:glycosyltransferase involved in cell wall biosynthesis